MRTLLSGLASLPLTIFVISASWADDPVLKHTDHEWGYAIHQSYEEESPSFWDQLIDPIRIFTQSRTIGRVTKVASGVSSAACGDFKSAGEYFANSVVNPFLTVESLVSDVVVALNNDKSPKGKKYTSRAQLCVTNLMASNQSDANLLGQAAIPFQHVGIIIDGTTEINFGGANLGNHPAQRQCKDMPIVSDEPVGVSIQKMKCLHSQMRVNADYNFVNYNCGGYARDLATAAGFQFEDLPNAGIGSAYPLLLYSPERIAINDKMPGFIQACQNQVDELQKLFAQIELGKSLTEKQFDWIKSTPLSPSASLQLVSAAARSGSNEIREQIRKILAQKWQIQGELSSLGSWATQTKDKERQASARNTIQSILQDIPTEGRDWLNTFLSNVAPDILHEAPSSAH